MRLVPDPVTCPEHPAQDLSAQVRERLEADPDVVANAFLRRGRSRRGLRRYLVVVTCPGGSPEGHEQDLEGSWEP